MQVIASCSHVARQDLATLTLCRGGRSLVESLVRECPGVDPSQYIGFYCLKNWGVMNDKVVTEQIYVHDKVTRSLWA